MVGLPRAVLLHRPGTATIGADPLVRTHRALDPAHRLLRINAWNVISVNESFGALVDMLTLRLLLLLTSLLADLLLLAVALRGLQW